MNGKQHMNYKQKAARARIKKIMIATGLVVGVSATGVTDIVQPFMKHMTTTVQASEITDFIYAVVNGTVTITGYNGGPVVTIPAEINGLPVTSIASDAFNNKGLTEVHFEGNNLTYIGPRAFANNNLTEFHMPNSVTSTGGYILTNNINLETVTLSSGLKSIPTSVLRDTHVKKVIIPDGVETIGPDAFRDATLTEVVIPASVTKIGYEAFQGNNIKEVVIPASVTKIDYRAFQGNNMANVYFAGDSTIIATNNVFDSNPGIIINAPDPSTAKQYAQAYGYQYMPWTAPKPEPETPVSNSGTAGSSTGSNSGETGSSTGSNSGETGSSTGSNSGEAGSSAGEVTKDSYVQKNDLSANITNGGLLLGNVDITNFGDIAITDKAKTYFTSINKPLNVKDLRGNQEGWELSVSATAMAGKNHALPKGSLTLDGVDTITSESSSAENMPAKKLVDRTIIDDGDVLIAKAEKGTGAGTFDIAFKENAIGLTIDPQTAKTGEYHSTITWTLASTPTSSTN